MCSWENSVSAESFYAQTANLGSRYLVRLFLFGEAALPEKKGN